MEITPLIKTSFVTVDENAPVSEMLGKLKLAEEREALVYKNGKYIGILEKKRLLKSGLESAETKLRGLTMKTPLLSEHTDVVETASLLYQSNLDVVPVQKQENIFGVLHALDVAHLGVHLPEAKPWKVDDVKLVQVEKLDKNQPVAAALALMYDSHLDQLPIIEKGKLYGILSYRDLLRNFLTWSPQREVSMKFTKAMRSKSSSPDSPHLVSLPLSNFCTKESLITAKANDTLKNAVDSMCVKNITCLPVMQGDKILGILTVKNILRLIGSLKMPKNYNIQFVGLHDLRLGDYQKEDLQKVCSNESFKLQRLIHNDFQLMVHVKGYHKTGSQKKGAINKKVGEQQKYAVNLRLEFPGKIVAASGDDWDVITALREAFVNMQNELKKRFRV
ncbi:CBS domain-containing protein [Candidatus Woesearchaeota archaeon]|nr:CBS domain-containing protein [Candidatus Woesearchaeota archaeon]